MPGGNDRDSIPSIRLSFTDIQSDFAGWVWFVAEVDAYRGEKKPFASPPPPGFEDLPPITYYQQMGAYAFDHVGNSTAQVKSNCDFIAIFSALA